MSTGLLLLPLVGDDVLEHHGVAVRLRGHSFEFFNGGRYGLRNRRCIALIGTLRR